MTFVTYQQRYDDENAVFYKSVDPAALEESALRLDKLVRGNYVVPELKERAEALSFRMRAKRYALLYFGDYGVPLCEEATAYLRRAIAVCEEKKYSKTLASLRALLALFEKTRSVIDGCETWLLRVRDKNGEPVTDDSAVFTEVEEAISRKLTEAEGMSSDAVFAKGVQFPDPKERVVADLKYELEGVRRALAKNLKRKEEELCARFIRPLSEEYGDFIEYYPLLGEGEGGLAATIALNTPFLREAELAVIQWAKLRGRESYLVHISAFSELPPENIGDIFSVLASKKADYLFSGIPACRDEKVRSAVLQGAFSLGKGGARVYLLDEEGKNALYGELFDLARRTDPSAVSGIGYHFLTLPYFRDVLALLLEKGAVTEEAELRQLSASVAFMGYEGLNAALTAYAQGNSWKERAIAASMKNKDRAMKYLSVLGAQYQLVDGEWGSFLDLTSRSSDKKHVDYDDIKMRDPVNIDKILQTEMTIFEKCGALARYCTLYGDDESVWKTLGKEEKSERMTEATRLVMRTLGVPLLPEVRVLSDKEWKEEGKDSSAGGLCCNGGTLILYRESSVDSYDWVIGAICHECYHAFQHMAIGLGWREWFYRELGVTKGRLPEWEYNFRNYYTDTKSQGYRVEVVESDARAFEHDCVEASGHFWNMIDFD